VPLPQSGSSRSPTAVDRLRANGVEVEMVDLGRISYDEALVRQRSIRDRVLAERAAGGGMTILLLEHDPPVVTVTRRPSAASHVLASPEALAARGVELRETDRGGDVTWHGPGQVVAYAILDLPRFGLRVGSHMRLLEQVVIDTIGEHGLEGRRDPGATGVWIGEGPAAAKIAAMGVRVGRGVSMHGLALNVDCDLSHFGLIVPCGLAGRPVTSMAKALGAAPPSVAEVKRGLAAAFARRLAALPGDSGDETSMEG
jgi:lipoyl(octanoyl) transferase